MMNSTRKRNRRHVSIRVCALVSTCMMLVMGLPACTGVSMHAPRSADRETSTVEQASAAVREPMMTPLVLGDETSKSLPVEQYEEPAGACSDALYIEEPMASGYVAVSVIEIEAICNGLQIECFRKCFNKAPPKGKGWKKGDGDHYKYCQSMCLAQFMECRRKLGIVTRVFDAFDAAWAWIKDHKAAIVGTIIVVGGVAYIVSTGGSGALVLIPLAG